MGFVVKFIGERYSVLIEEATYIRRIYCIRVGLRMPKGDKYIGLVNYLKSISTDNITLTFADIEKIIGDALPSSAYKHRAFWANTRSRSVAFGWLDAGYRISGVDFTNQQVVFVKK